MEAYEDALSAATSARRRGTSIPADRKWYRNLVISQIMARTLEGLKLQIPKPKMDLSKVRIL